MENIQVLVGLTSTWLFSFTCLQMHTAFLESFNSCLDSSITNWSPMLSKTLPKFLTDSKMVSLFIKNAISASHYAHSCFCTYTYLYESRRKIKNSVFNTREKNTPQMKTKKTPSYWKPSSQIFIRLRERKKKSTHVHERERRCAHIGAKKQKSKWMGSRNTLI